MTDKTAEQQQQPIRHDWDDQDKCRRCGDRDWYASGTCTPKQQPADSELARLRERVRVLEEQWAVVFDGYAVRGFMESRGQYAHPPLICATLDAVAAIGKERAASLRGGSDE